MITLLEYQGEYIDRSIDTLLETDSRDCTHNNGARYEKGRVI